MVRRMPQHPDAPVIVGNRWDALDGVAPASLPRVSVIVAHYDQPVQLARTLRALADQDYPCELLEVVVADDGSPGEVAVPDDVVLVRQADDGFRLAAVRNLGVRASTGEVLCFLDADTAPEPGYVRALTRLPALHPDAVTVGRRRHAEFSENEESARGDGGMTLADAVTGRELPEPAWLADAYARSRNLLDADDRSYRYVIGAVMACGRALFDEVGGFDETFRSYGGEDWEWAYRMWSAGAVLAHIPEAVAWHDGPEWADRRGSEQARANAQTLTLARSIPVSGSAPRALRPTAPDLVVRLRGAHPEAAVFVAVDALLLAFPTARIVLDAGVVPPWEDPRVVAAGAEPDARVVWDLPRPVVVTDPEWIRALVTGLGAGEVGTVELVDGAGRDLGILRSRRAERRAVRRGDAAGFRTVTAEAVGIHLLRSDPDVEAWVGGWGGAERFS